MPVIAVTSSLGTWVMTTPTFLILLLVVGTVSPADNTTLLLQIVLGVIVTLQLLIQLYHRREDRLEREAKAKEVKAEAVETRKTLVSKVDQNTEVTREAAEAGKEAARTAAEVSAKVDEKLKELKERFERIQIPTNGHGSHSGDKHGG